MGLFLCHPHGPSTSTVNIHHEQWSYIAGRRTDDAYPTTLPLVLGPRMYNERRNSILNLNFKIGEMRNQILSFIVTARRRRQPTKQHHHHHHHHHHQQHHHHDFRPTEPIRVHRGVRRRRRRYFTKRIICTHAKSRLARAAAVGREGGCRGFGIAATTDDTTTTTTTT